MNTIFPPAPGVPWAGTVSASNASGAAQARSSQASQFLNRSGSTFDGFTASNAVYAESSHDEYFAMANNRASFRFELVTPHTFSLTADDAYLHGTTTTRLYTQAGDMLVDTGAWNSFDLDLSADTYSFFVATALRSGEWWMPSEGLAYDFSVQFTETPASVPEPSTLLLLGGSLLGLTRLTRWK